MNTYILVESNIINADKLAEYGQQAAITLAHYGGRFIAKGPASSLHGQSAFSHRAIIEFDNEQRALDWYHSDAYQALVPLREQALSSQFQMITTPNAL
ncbi:DUF1330 domain-containing protein [Motilimonas pumila]|uniref:DUF1330 domain-containing protein n=1 Tax=Motilimonas pumila TaxID=2303987 RepID=A0A418YE49_9GAMM|nr:DUF1330 domain-containing protein [Motilimonas pumila]RJG42754.1 DUF1330 domain-containing protein [Motilimonas pumila]